MLPDYLFNSVSLFIFPAVEFLNVMLERTPLMHLLLVVPLLIMRIIPFPPDVLIQLGILLNISSICEARKGKNLMTVC